MRKIKTLQMPGQDVYCLVYINKKGKHFLIDTGADSSYIYYKPTGSVLQKSETLESMYLLGNRQIFYKLIDKGQIFWYTKKTPEAIKTFQESYKIKLYGIIGLDYLRKNKIILDLGKL